MIAWLKAIHIASLVAWCAGLLVLPGLYAQKARVGDEDALHHLQRFTRFVYTAITSPAAFVAVGTGTALIFAREVFTAWMALKLAAVGTLVLLHVHAGYIIVRVFRPGRRFAAWRGHATALATFAVISAILWLVLSKPFIDMAPLPDWMRQPGGLQSFSDSMRPI
ncbi:CopD family protein [Microvirga sp. M2]|uniref:CopD family protein n=1 Tax=Microvirga sp. M2 TaxID=3073270 RepID=UPI0039C1D040